MPSLPSPEEGCQHFARNGTIFPKRPIYNYNSQKRPTKKIITKRDSLLARSAPNADLARRGTCCLPPVVGNDGLSSLCPFFGTTDSSSPVINTAGFTFDRSKK